jgi:predicted nuclease of restriction endonuclease-like (RecB) superfamily
MKTDEKNPQNGMNDAVSVDLYASIKEIITNARSSVNRTINTAMVHSYWHIGRLIMENEQQGAERAGYGEAIIENLSRKLTDEFGKGFTATNLKYMRQFYQVFPNSHSLRDQLSWTHYRLLIRVEKPSAREWYMDEAVIENWSTRVLERQINSFYYERLLMSKDKQPVLQEAKEKTALPDQEPAEFIKDPYVLEFLNIKDRSHFRESELENAIIQKVQEFLLELGKGFAFVARQKRISTENSEFYIDLVFYNYNLKCFVLVDLKTGKLTHQDVGQMDMYVRMFDDIQKNKDDNPTVGLILCTEKDKAIVKYSVLNENKQLFASKYMLYLPSEEELAKELEREKRLIMMEMEADKYGTKRQDNE